MTHITKGEFLDIKIPLPPLETQNQIVEELDGYQKIIDGCRQVVENYKPTIDIDQGWEMFELNEVCEIKGRNGELLRFLHHGGGADGQRRIKSRNRREVLL